MALVLGSAMRRLCRLYVFLDCEWVQADSEEKFLKVRDHDKLSRLGE